MRCPECGAENETGARFCADCGMNLVAAPVASRTPACPKCGAPLDSGMKFCADCGSPLPTGNEGSQELSTARQTSGAWWLLPIFMAWVGGLIAFLVLKDDDRAKAKRLLIAGLIMTVIWIALNIGLSVLAYNLDSSSW